ncbi:hypothetical protein KC221_21065 [Mycobacterium tuberculosis]|nr:hypothetical protein [Mycobacterium tuberculosis]
MSDLFEMYVNVIHDNGSLTHEFRYYPAITADAMGGLIATAIREADTEFTDDQHPHALDLTVVRK